MSASTTSALKTPTPMNAKTRSTPKTKVAVSLPFHGMMTFISEATSCSQPSPSALMMPSVTTFTAPFGASEIISTLRRAGDLSMMAAACDSRACSAMRRE